MIFRSSETTIRKIVPMLRLELMMLLSSLINSPCVALSRLSLEPVSTDAAFCPGASRTAMISLSGRWFLLGITAIRDAMGLLFLGKQKDRRDDEASLSVAAFADGERPVDSRSRRMLSRDMNLSRLRPITSTRSYSKKACTLSLQERMVHSLSTMKAGMIR